MLIVPEARAMLLQNVTTSMSMWVVILRVRVARNLSRLNTEPFTYLAYATRSFQ